MLRLFALSTLAVCPPAYFAMKFAAEDRHAVFNQVLEGGDGDLDDTWHERAIDWVYPV